ncbi:lysosome membrane protein 2-like isoform X2 [Patiria miniata]|uniref:Platelet glycoprotein 4 n=1 Tax=Patiria miniata TaxID=46514 RepID=A0A913ZUT4_PATMI|nr:lysosome membrane protein 2-like isoform X2 [Patiria miniata]
MGHCCCSKNWVYVFGVLGAFLIILGGVLVVVVNIFITATVETDTTLVEGSTAFETWVETPTPVYMQYYVWNLTNKEEFLNGSKPAFEEVGPYTYREIRRKSNISFDDEDGTVTFYNYKAYIFDRDQSVGWDNDTFTTIDLPTVTFGHVMQYSDTGKFLHKLVHRGSLSNLIIDVSVVGFMYGFEQPYLTFLNSIFTSVELPTEFGIFYGSNDTLAAEWVVYTGQTDVSLVNQIKTWNNLTSLTYWSNEYANMLNGTDGQAFHPFLTEDDVLYIYVPDICRAGVIEYTGPNELRGIPTAKYSAPAYQYASAEEYPDNIGFCTPDESGCTPNGLLNATTCKTAPIFYSSPHFLYGSTDLLDSVIGFNPIQDQHKVDFDIEMLTGVAMQVSNRLQVNIKVGPLSQISESRNIPSLYFPYFWLNESSVLDEATADFFKGDVQNLLLIADCVKAAVFSVGAGIFVGSVIIFMVRCYRAQKRRKLTDRRVITVQGEPKPDDGIINTTYDHEYDELPAAQPSVSGENGTAKFN